MQEQLDRWVFYRDRYDARVTITEFARELSSETDMNAMLAKVSDRLLRTLSIQQVGFFLWDESEEEFRVHSLSPRPGKAPKSAPLHPDLSFLTAAEDKQYLFFERPKHLHDIVSEKIGRHRCAKRDCGNSDFTYYVACKSRNRAIAFLASEPYNRRRFSFERRYRSANHVIELRGDCD